MSRPSHLPLHAPLLAALFAAHAQAQAVLTVDDDPGTGADFQQVVDALNAANEGDTILVRSGTYDGFVSIGKSFSLIAENDATVLLTGGVSIRGLAPGQQVVLRGIEVVSAAEEGLYLRNNDGAVWVEDSRFTGAFGDNTGIFNFQTSEPGALIWSCAQVVLERCEFIGGFGFDLEDEDYELFPATGDDGLRVRESSVTLHACSATGGSGGSVLDTDTSSGAFGGSGLHLESGRVSASGCSFTGANGGAGGSEFGLFTGCGSGGDAGDGVRVEPGEFATFIYQECQLTAGTAGPGGIGCSAGDSGLALNSPPSAAIAQAGIARNLRLQSTPSAGGTLEVSIEGLAGELVLLGRSSSCTILPVSLFGGDLVLQDPIVLLTLGTLATDGATLLSLPLPGLPDPLLEGLGLHAQSLHLTPTGELWLGHGSFTTILDLP